MAKARQKKASKRAASERAQRKRAGEIESPQVEKKAPPKKQSWIDRMSERIYKSTVLVRLIAGVCDFLVSGMLTLMVIVVPYYWMSGGQNLGQLGDYLALGITKPMVALLVLVALVLNWCYYVLVPTRKWPGQTVGKHVMNLEVVKVNGDEAEIGTLTVRWLCSLLTETPVLTVTPYLMQLVGLLTNSAVMTTWQFVALVTTIISFGMMVAGMNHRALHDRVAGTWVYRQ